MLKEQRDSTIIFLHDNNENPQKYLKMFWHSYKDQVTPWDRQPHVLMVQAPNIVQEKDGVKSCAWGSLSEDPLQSPCLDMVNQIVEQQIQAAGRADRVFIGGQGYGGQIALAAAFKSQHVLAGVFCLDAAVPESIYNLVFSKEGSSVFPQYEAKKNMWICLTKNLEMSEEMMKQIGQQGQLLRGRGFLRLHQAPLKQSIERALAQFHVYSRLGGQDEYQEMLDEKKAIKGDFDSKAQKALGIK